MSAADKDKLDNIEAEANVNKIESIKLNSSTLDIADDKSVNIDLSNYPTTSDMKEAETTLTNTIATLQTTIDELTARVAALENVVSW